MLPQASFGPLGPEPFIDDELNNDSNTIICNAKGRSDRARSSDTTRTRSLPQIDEPHSEIQEAKNTKLQV